MNHFPAEFREADGDAPHRPSTAIRLRAWQREALELFEASASPDFLAVATPGSGKTAFALSAARRALVARRVSRLVVVVPTEHLKGQWAHAAEGFDIHLDADWSSGYGTLPSDVHGVVVTYQQVAANPEALRPLVRGALVVLDEIHHAGESRSWGDAVRIAFEHAPRRLCLSGTPFRSDDSTIPFVRYDDELARADYEYGYGQALSEGTVVRPVYFPRINGRMEWTAPDGQMYQATFDDRLGRPLASQRLRTALAVEGDWLPTVLRQAHAQLLHLRRRDARAGGLVIATDQQHARGIAQMMRQHLGVSATVATSDDPAASGKIAEFATGSAPWIVAVRMISEGVDIPRLCLGVYATNTVTELFFRQAVGRVVRWNAKLGRQTAYMFIPDDLRLRTFAAQIAEQRRHSLRKREEDGPQTGDEPGQPRGRQGDPLPDEQLSLFAAISAVPLDEHGRPLEQVRLYDEGQGEEIPDLAPIPGEAFPFLPPPPVSAVPLPEAEAAPPPATGALARRRQLRELNSQIVIELVHITGKRHPEVNAELNRRVGIRRITEATVRQLERRLAAAKAWMRKR